MDDETRLRLQGTFDRAAAPYASARPGYPDPVPAWLLGLESSAAESAPSVDVLDLGAGSGALTRVLRPWCRRLLAVEPSANLLGQLGAAVRTEGRVRATAERLPFGDATFDHVTVATAFHWFDPATALPEIARVLCPGGSLALVWNVRALTSPVARAVEQLLRRAQPPALRGEWGSDSARALDDSAWFEPPARADFAHAQLVDRSGFVDLVSSRSYVIALGADERTRLLARALRLVDEHADRHGLVEIPYVARCWRAARR